MDQTQRDLIPNRDLANSDTRPLLKWLDQRGWFLTLAELDQERHHRHITPPIRHR